MKKKDMGSVDVFIFIFLCFSFIGCLEMLDSSTISLLF